MTAYLTTRMINQRISHSWRTSIQETIEGDEKRSALFTWPRVRLENKLWFYSDEERRFIHTHLFRDTHNLWGVPVVSDKTFLTSEAASAQAILTVDATGERHFYDGRQCVLVSAANWESYEVATLTTVDSGTQITLSGNLSATWPIGTIVYPLYDCRIKPVQIITAPWVKINSLEIMATESFESTRSFSYTVPTVDVAVYPVYNSLNLFLTEPMRPLTETYRHPYTLSGGIGLQTAFSTYGDTRGVFDRTIQCTSRKEIYDLFDFFDAKQGRLETFYSPTWMEDIVITTGFDAADVTLTVKDVYFTSAEMIGRHIYIQFPDGTYACREITSMPTSEVIGIAAIGTTVATANVSNVLCCFLPEVRFNVDEIAFDYLYTSIARTKLSFNSI